MAAVASVLARSNTFKAMLMRENRTLGQRVSLAAWLSAVFGACVAVRVARQPLRGHRPGPGRQPARGSVGRLRHRPGFGNPRSRYPHFPPRVSDPAAAGRHRGARRPAARPGARPGGSLALLPVPRAQHLPLLQGETQPLADRLSAHFFRGHPLRRSVAAGHGAFQLRNRVLVFCPKPPGADPNPVAVVAMYCTTLFAVAIPLKIWNSTRNEKKLEEQERLLVEARLAALRARSTRTSCSTRSIRSPR